MARIRFDAKDFEGPFGKLGRPVIERIVDAGARTAIERMRANALRARHGPPGISGRATGEMLESIGSTELRETFGGGSKEVYPLGEDRRGERNATKAYVLNYGRGKKLRGDRFITADEDALEEAVHEAMQAELNLIRDEENG